MSVVVFTVSVLLLIVVGDVEALAVSGVSVLSVCWFLKFFVTCHATSKDITTKAKFAKIVGITLFIYHGINWFNRR